MKLLLDAMWSPEIARQLRLRGHDAVAVVERSELRTKSDDVVFATAQEEGRALLTEDAHDFRVIASYFVMGGGVHFGLIFTDDRRLPRSRPGTLGRVVTALAALLDSDVNLQNREYWLS